MNETVKVLNRFLGQTTYVIPELHIRRTFQRGAEQEVPFKELQYLKYQAGGEEMLRNILMIEDAEALEKLVGEVEPEYHYTESDVENLLLNGSLAQLEDALDFAPLGVIELIKEKAVSLKISDINKRDAIAKKTEFNVTNAINNVELEKKAEQEETNNTTDKKENSSGRRTQPMAKVDNKTPERRVPAASKYKILD